MRCGAPSSAGDGLDLGRCRKTPDRFVFRVEGLEHGQQLRDRQEIRDAFGQVEQLEAPPLPANGRIRADDFAEACAVDVWHAREVEDDLFVPLVDQAVDLFLEQLIPFPQVALALQVEYYHVPDVPFLDLHEKAPEKSLRASLTHPPSPGACAPGSSEFLSRWKRSTAGA